MLYTTEKKQNIAEEWKNIPKLPLCYEISNKGKVRQRVGFKNVEIKTYNKGNHVYVTLTDSNFIKQEIRLLDLVLMTYNEHYYKGCRVRFKDGNLRNVSIGNMVFKRKPTHYSADASSAKLWKCGRKAGSANSRYNDSTLEKISSDDVYRVLEIMQFKCFYCGDDLDKHTWHLDHFTPVSKGGHNNFKNLAASCAMCNTMKSDLDGNQFFKMIKKLSSTKIFKNKGDFA